MFKFAYNTSNRVGQPRKHPIATGTNIPMGASVIKTNGLVVLNSDGDSDIPVLGISAEKHDGSTAGRQAGTEILIYDDPNDVFSLIPRTAITATGGSTTTFVDSNLKFAVDDQLNGGYIEVVTCAADSSQVGRKIKITDYTASGGTITLGETLPVAFAAGDTAYLCPGRISIGAYFTDMATSGLDVNWEDTDAGETLQIHDVDPETFRVFFKARLHLNASYPVGI
jgi:hypothetical protein